MYNIILGGHSLAHPVHCKYFGCTLYSFWQCYVSHCNLAVHVTAQNSNWSQTVLLNVIECHRYSRWLWLLLPNYCGKCNTANDCNLAVNICSVSILILNGNWLCIYKIGINYQNQETHSETLSLLYSKRLKWARERGRHSRLTSFWMPI